MSSPPPRTSRWQAWRRRFRRMYVRVLRSPGEPRDIALGVAVGVAVSLIPVAQTLIALGVVGLIRRLSDRRPSYIAAALGTWFTNPFTFAPVYALTTLVGRPIAHALLEHTGVSAMPGSWFSGPAVLETSLGVVIGAIIVGLPLSVAAFEVSRRVVEGYQRRRIAKQRARALRAVGADALLTDGAALPEAPSRAASGS